MLVSPATAATLRALADPPRAADESVRGGRELIDTVKRRSTLVGLIEPLAIGAGLALNPGETLGSLGDIASSLVHGDFSEAGGGLGGLVGRAYHPDGFLGGVYRSGLVARAAAGTLVGTLEIREGVKNRDLYLGLMGGADLVGSGAAAAVAVGQPAVGMALSIASSAAKVALVVRRPDQYTRVQKVKTLFDAGGSVASGMLKAGILVVPALVATALLGPTQMLYMNHDGFRARADRAIDWVADHVRRRPEAAA